MTALGAAVQVLAQLLAIDVVNETREAELPGASRNVRDMVRTSSALDLGGEAVASEVFGPLLQVFIEESASTGQDLSKVSSVSYLKSLFGDNHAYLIDIYGALSSLLDEEGRLMEARELAGQSLLISMNVFGLMHVKTGECHLRLGILFGKNGPAGKDSELSRKELRIARGIFRSEVGSLSEEVGDCEYYLAQVEAGPDKAFNHIYSSYMCRHQSLGETHRSTLATRNLMEEKRRFRGTDAFLAVEEVYFRLQDLKWSEAESTSIQFTIAMFIRHMLENRERAITCKQLRDIMVAALRHRNSSDDRGLFLPIKISSPTSGGGGSPLKALSTAEYQVTDRLHKEFISGLLDGEESTAAPFSLLSSPTGAVDSRIRGGRTPTNSLHDFVRKWHMRNPPSPISPPRSRAIRKEGGLRSRFEEEDGLKSNSHMERKESMLAEAESKVNEDVEEKDVRPDSDNKELTNFDEASVIEVNKLAILQEQYSRLGVDSFQTPLLPFSISSRDGITLALDKNRELMAIQHLSHFVQGKLKVEEVQKQLREQTSERRDASRGADSEGVEAKHGRLAAVSSARGEVSMAQKSDDPPSPPPLPKSWPPHTSKLTVESICIPAGADDMSSKGSGSRKSKSSKVTRDTAEKHVVTFTSDSGKVVTGAFAAKRAADAQKMKNTGIKVEIVSLKISDLSGTIFDNAEGLNESDLVTLSDLFEDLEDEFVKQKKRKSVSVMRRMSRRISTIPKSPDGTPRTESARKFDAAKGNISNGASALDPRRDQNLSIMLARFGKQKCSEIAAAAYNFEYEKLGLTAATALSQYIPTADEIKSVDNRIKLLQTQLPESGVEGILNKMSRPEQYVYYLGKVPHLSKTLAAMMFCLNNTEVAQKCRRDADEIIRACHEIKASVRLKYVLQKLLQLLASINNKKLTDDTEGGFRLSTLQSLTKVKTNSGDTVEQYFICRLYNSVPESLDLAHDLPSVTNSHKVSLDSFATDVKNLKEGMDTTQELLNDLENKKEDKSNSEDGFDYDTRLASLSKKHEEFENMHNQSAELLKEATEEFQALCAYFGEDPNDTSPQEIFGALRDFTSRVTFCIDQVTSKAKRIARRKSQIE